MNTVLALGVLGVFGSASGLVAHRVGLPRITGYLIAGILIGPSLLDIISSGTSDDLSELITPFALGIIAFMIGGSLMLSKLRGLTRSILSIGFFQSVCPWALVVVLVSVLGPIVLPEAGLGVKEFVALAVVAGAISLATAPATTLAVVEESRSRGPLTTTLLGVVALDDALAVVGYAFAVGIAAILLDTADTLDPTLFFLKELGRIGLSAALGLGMALPMILVAYARPERMVRIVMTLALLLLAAGLAERLDLLLVITNMTLGFAVVNAPRPAEGLVDAVGQVEDVVFVLFFTLAGTALELDEIREAGALAALIIVGRTTGKLVGVSIGGRIAGTSEVVRRYLGMALLPQAGIAVGLALLILETPELAPIATLLVSGVLASTLVNELIAPPLAKFALARAGEAKHRAPP